MTPSERILLRLDAHECWAKAAIRARASPKPAGVEPVVVAGGAADFGTNLLGNKSILDLQDQMTLWAGRMQQLGQTYANFSPSWVARDSKAFIDWTSDWTRLQNRYNAALKAAQSALSIAKFSPVPNSQIAAQLEWDGLAKAATQCYPPDGCPQAKGDWGELFDRLTVATKAAGAPPPVDRPAQPTAPDLDMQFFAATAPLDVVAQVTGAQAPTSGPLPANVVRALQGAPGLSGPLGVLSWLANHKTALLVGGVVVVSAVVLAPLLPAILGPLKAMKGMAALAA